MYYDYAEQVLAKGPNSEECSRMYNIAEQKLYEVCTTIFFFKKPYNFSIQLVTF